MELQQTVQRGNSLLQRKEERLQELINTVAEEVRENISHHLFVGGAKREKDFMHFGIKLGVLVTIHKQCFY